MLKRIELLQLTLRNFKGIRDFILDAGAADTDVFGDNGTGKTTLFDAFTWLLFDKDSQNKKDFEIKTLDAGGRPLHNLEHEVEASLMINGRRTTLRKVYKETWTKKRGSATAEFTGHTTDYFIDGVPSKKGEYSAKVDEIVQEDIFKLLTSPTFFNENMKWQERRKILLDVCGDVSDEDVIASNPSLVGLPDILKDRSIDDHRKVIASKRAEINRELEKIPVRIDEVQRSIPDTSDLDEEGLRRQIEILKSRIESKADEITRIKSGGEIAAKEKRLREIESDTLAIKNRLQSETLEKSSGMRKQLSQLRGELDDLQQQQSQKQRMIERNSREIEQHSKEAAKLREQWHAVNGEGFAHCGDESCPTCGQSLPEEQIQATRARAEAQFNRHKAEKLEAISARGRAAAGEAKRLEEVNEGIKVSVQSLSQQIEAKTVEVRKAENDLKVVETGVPDVNQDPEYRLLQNEANQIMDEIVALRDRSWQAVQKAEDELRRLRYQEQELLEQEGRFVLVRAAEQRIEQLAQQEKQLASEYERLEHELYLTEEFIRCKVSMLESRINSKFKMARFKLFEQQINGGLTEVCETLYNGVPYSGGLNNAARINVGLDIINTLSDHYGIAAPIFVDNAEAVTLLIDTNGQKVRLVVSAAEKKLRVEAANKIREAV